MTVASQRAYSALLSRIQSGALVSGAYLVESEIATDLGLSRTPVREAIRRLAAEGLVRTEGRRRAIVREFDDDAVDELYEIRARLEGYAAHRAASRIAAPTLESLRELAREMESCVGNADAARFADLNDRFHQAILDAAHGEHLTAALRPILQIQLLMLQRYRHRIVEHLERSCWHHRELIRAFELRDPGLAESQMMLHMMSARASGPVDEASP